nr:recombinase family protein [Desulfotruncus arcticus]
MPLGHGNVKRILGRMEYLGHTVNFKTSWKSYKSKKKLENPPEDRRVFENTHPAIIEQVQWDRVQELRKNKRRPTKTGRTSMFSGLLYCADCGEKLRRSLPATPFPVNNTSLLTPAVYDGFIASINLAINQAI